MRRTGTATAKCIGCQAARAMQGCIVLLSSHVRAKPRCNKPASAKRSTVRESKEHLPHPFSSIICLTSSQLLRTMRPIHHAVCLRASSGLRTSVWLHARSLVQAPRRPRGWRSRPQGTQGAAGAAWPQQPRRRRTSHGQQRSPKSGHATWARWQFASAHSTDAFKWSSVQISCGLI